MKVKTPAININIIKIAISFPVFSEQEYWLTRSWQSNSEEHGWSAHSSVSVKEVFIKLKILSLRLKGLRAISILVMHVIEYCLYHLQNRIDNSLIECNCI